MLQAERKLKIIDFVKKNTSATIARLANEFNVHEVTIRRDLAGIEKEGILKRTHGGVIVNHWTNEEESFNERSIQHLEEKMKIGKKAASMVDDGDNIIIDSGTTTSYIAKYLKNHTNIVVVTNDMNVAIELKDCAKIKVILTGGELYHSSYMLNGMFTDRTLQSLRVVKAFVGTPALHQKHGLMHMEAQLVPAKQKMIEAAEETIVVTDSSKIGKIALHQIAPLSSINTLITGTEAPREEIDYIQNKGVMVIQI